jgi:hypothetical protein
MNAGAARSAEPTKRLVSCDVIVLETLLSAKRLQALKGVWAEASGSVISLHGRMDPATRRLAERLARAVLGAKDVRFENAA